MTPTDRMRDCLRELGLAWSGELAQLKPLSRLVSDLIPDRRTLLEFKAAVCIERDRRASAERRLDAAAEAIERLLCDMPSKNELVRGLERIRADMAYGTEIVP